MLETLIGRLSDPHTVFPYLYEPVSQQIIILGMFIFIVLITSFGLKNSNWTVFIEEVVAQFTDPFFFLSFACAFRKIDCRKKKIPFFQF